MHAITSALLFALHAATREWGAYENATASIKPKVVSETSSDVAWRRTQSIMLEMERAVDERKYGYKRFGAPQASLVPLKRINIDDKQGLMCASSFWRHGFTARALTDCLRVCLAENPRVLEQPSCANGEQILLKLKHDSASLKTRKHRLDTFPVKRRSPAKLL